MYSSANVGLSFSEEQSTSFIALERHGEPRVDCPHYFYKYMANLASTVPILFLQVMARIYGSVLAIHAIPLLDIYTADGSQYHSSIDTRPVNPSKKFINMYFLRCILYYQSRCARLRTRGSGQWISQPTLSAICKSGIASMRVIF